VATIEANPQLGEQVREDAKRYVLHSWSVQDAINPLPVAGAEGRYFWDYDGKRYLDFASQLVNVSIGYGHPKVVAAIKEQAGLDSVQLGFALLGSPLGSVLAMTFAGYAAGRFGSHRVTVAMLLICAAALPLIASASSFVHLAGALFLFGAAYGSMDVCMNANGLAIERAGTTPIMSRLHASWSIGSFLGAFSTTIALQAGLSVVQQFSLLAVAMVASAVVLSLTMLPERHASTGALFTRPPRRLVLVGFVALCALIAEGSAGDWSGVFIKDNIGGTAQEAALAITFLSATMAGVRLAGDSLAPHRRWRHRRRDRPGRPGGTASASRWTTANGTWYSCAHPAGRSHGSNPRRRQSLQSGSRRFRQFLSFPAGACPRGL